MLTEFAGFNVPEVMIPLYALMVVFLSLITWLIWYLIQQARGKSLPKLLFLRIAAVYTLLMIILVLIAP